MSDQFDAVAGQYEKKLISFVREIVSIPSITGAEGEVVSRLQQEMLALEFDDVRVDAMGNLIGTIGNGPRLLAIDEHCDTVGPGDLEQWDDDPYSGVLRDGKVFGRGASDQKGGLAAAVYAAKIVAEIGLPDSCSLCVVASDRCR